MLPVEPAAIVPVSHDGSDFRVAVWPVLSLFVQVTTSPTLAVIVAGLNAKPAMVAATVPVSVEAEHPPAAPALSDAPALSEAAALSDAAGDSLGAAALGADDAVAAVEVPPLEHAETMSSSAAPAARRNVRDMSISSCVRIRGLRLDTCGRYDQSVNAVS